MAMFDIIKAMFDAYKESPIVQERKHKQKFNELTYTPFLFSGEYLKELYLELDSVEDCEIMLDYIDRFRLTEKNIGFYDKLHEHTLKERDKQWKKLHGKDDDNWLDWA